jgi:hypothetical protein
MSKAGRPPKDGIHRTYYFDRELMEQVKDYADEHNMTITSFIEKALTAALLVQNPAWLNIQTGFLTVLGDMPQGDAERLLGALSGIGKDE